MDGGYQWCESSHKCIRPWMTECLDAVTDTLPNNCHKDIYDKCIDEDCSSWFDGCNTCMVSENGILGCTKMYCINPSVGECLNYNSIKLQGNDICYRFCEDSSEVTINKKNDCPSGTSCLSSSQSMISFDSCGNRAHRCLNPH